jgi:hypothetical protein
MQPLRIDRNVFCTILSGTYSPEDLHEFVQVCYALALPTIRKKIALGKLNLGIIGLTENDIVHDCLADLFQREDSPQFPQIVRFFQAQTPDLNAASDERLLITLRRLVLGKVHNNIIRLYAEADPILGRVFRNMTLALERTHLFDKQTRFGEGCLLACGTDLLCGLPPIPMEFVHEKFAAIASAQDTIPQMLRKLHAILSDQEEYQRVVPFVGVAIMFKEVHARAQEIAEEVIPQQSEDDNIAAVIESVCRQLEGKMHKSYVTSGKKSAEVFHQYMIALKDMLMIEFVQGEPDGISYFETLRQHMPQLTKAAYARQHRTAFEYIAKTAKECVRRELRTM